MSRRRIAQVLIVFAFLAVPILIYFAPEAVAWIYGIIFFLAPLWLPLLLLSIAWPLWLSFIRSQFIAGIPYTTLELKPGDETPPTARAMELVFHSLYHRTEVTRLDAFLFGKVRNFWSFELYAHNGRVRFFVHLPVQYRVALEGRIRAEYHDIDIHEVRDYSREIDFNPLRMRMIAREYSLVKPDPYPLKTYIAHEESLSKRDVFGEVVEGLANVGEKEHVLFSIIMRPHQRERDGIFEPATDSLHESAHQEIRKLVGAKGEMQNLPQSTK
ncbi:MAG: hypothetical protein V4437_03540, partial [Patescibacteria group bacterium]